jgi:hypothetical protein
LKLPVEQTGNEVVDALRDPRLGKCGSHQPSHTLKFDAFRQLEGNGYLRLALAMDPIFRLFRWLLPIDDLPVRSVGIAASCVFGLALAFGQLLHFIFLA